MNKRRFSDDHLRMLLGNGDRPAVVMQTREDNYAECDGKRVYQQPKFTLYVNSIEVEDLLSEFRAALDELDELRRLRTKLLALVNRP